MPDGVDGGTSTTHKSPPRSPADALLPGAAARRNGVQAPTHSCTARPDVRATHKPEQQAPSTTLCRSLKTHHQETLRHCKCNSPQAVPLSHQVLRPHAPNGRDAPPPCNSAPTTATTLKVHTHTQQYTRSLTHTNFVLGPFPVGCCKHAGSFLPVVATLPVCLDTGVYTTTLKPRLRNVLVAALGQPAGAAVQGGNVSQTAPLAN